jgi:hypothetical protein
VTRVVTPEMIRINLHPFEPELRNKKARIKKAVIR